MTYIELAERELEKAKRNLMQAWNKPNVTAEELENLHRLVEFRQVVCELIHKEFTFTEESNEVQHS